jgi:hypothetical protein
MAINDINKLYLIEEREGDSHGEVYELELDTYYDVVNIHTGKTVMTFTGTAHAKLGSEGWENWHYSGVEKVEFTEDGKSLLVHSCEKKEPAKIKLPG